MTGLPVQQRADRSSFERVTAALDERGCRPRLRGDHLDARCPAHEDRKPSLSVDWRETDRGGMTVVCCHTGCGGDAVVDALGLSWVDLFDSEVSPAQPMRNSGSVDFSRPRPAPAPKPRTPPARRGWPRGLGKPAAVYPYRSAAGELLYEIARWETPEGKTFRGRTPVPDRAGWFRHVLPPDRVLYRLPELAAAIERGAPVYLVEGERDADNLAAAGVTATTKPNGAVKSPEDWRPSWTRTLTGAHVVIVADRDEAGYRHAAAVRAALGEVPTSVRVVRTPLTGPKADVSDHLDAGLPLEDLEPVPEAELTAAVAGQPMRKSGSAELRNSASADTGRVLPGPWPPRDDGKGGGEPPAPVLRIVRDQYVADDCGLYKLGRSRSRDPETGEHRQEARELLNVRVRLARRVRRDMGDGTRPVVSHVDLAAARAAERVDLDAIEWKDFEGLSWAGDLPWSDVVYRRTAAGRSDVVNAIVTTSGEVPVVTAYGTLGWRRRDDGTWMYVHAAGAIDAAGPVVGTRVDIPTDLHCYALPAPPTDPATLAEAVGASTALLWEVRARISAPLLGAAYRSILGESSTTVFLLGEKGTFKSGLAANVLQHSAPSVRYNEMPAGAGEDTATMTSLEEWRYIAGHMPFAADDLAPDRGVERSAVRANILARSQYNRKGKLRGKRDGGTRPHHPPRGLLLLTGEDGASAPSAENRVVYVPLARGDVPLATLKALTTPELCAARAQLTAALVRWAAPRMDGMKEWITQRRNEYAEALTDPGADPGTEARRAEAAGDLLVGWRVMLDATVELGAMTQEEAEDLWKLAWCGMADAKARQAAVTDRRTLPERTADLLQGALVAGHAHIAGPDGGIPNVPPEELRAWGWTTLPGSFPAMSLDARPNGDRVGWLRAARVYLHPPSTMSVLLKQSKAEGEPLPALERSLAAALTGSGLIQTTDETDSQRRGTRHSFEHKQRRVWDLPVSWLFPDHDDPEPAAGPNSAPPPASLPADPAAGGAEQAATPELTPPAPSAAAPAPERVEVQNSVPAEQSVQVEPAAPPDRGTRVPVAPTRQPRDYRGLAVVVDADRAHLCTPGAVTELPSPPGTLPELLTWAEQELGTHHAYARDDYGQVWLTPAAADRYGLPTACPEKHTDRLGVVRRLADTGWRLGGKGLTRWWVNAYREGGRTVALVVPGWITVDGCRFVAGDPAPEVLARRIADYALLVGTPWQVSSGVTGLRALELSRIRSKVKVTEAAQDLPALCHRSRPDVPDGHDLRWQRPPAPDEAQMRYVHAYDLNGQYLAASSSVRLGIGPPEHRGASKFDASLPGYWRVDAPHWGHARLPDPFDPLSRGRRGGGLVWLTTPRLAALLNLGWLPTETEPSEAYVWPTLAEGARVPGTRYLEHWYTRLRDALTTSDDLTDPAPVRAAIKDTYAHGLGRLAKDDQRGKPLYRPDWRHHVMGTATANMLRKLAGAADDEGRYPLALAVDTVLYASDDPNPVAACPAALTLSAQLGKAKPVGTAQMSAVASLLSTGPRPALSLIDLFKKG